MITRHRLLALGLLVLTVNGCASFPGDRLAKVGTLPSRSEFANKPAVYFAVRFMADLSGGKRPPIERAEPLPMMRQTVERIATESGLFRSYTLESFQAGTTDYTLQLEMLNHGSLGAAAAGGLVTGLTLFIVPSAVTDKYTLTARVFDRDGQLLKTYTYDDEITTWFGIWLLPVAAKTPLSAVSQVWQNMVRAFLRDLTQDSVLQYSSRADSRAA